MELEGSYCTPFVERKGNNSPPNQEETKVWSKALTFLRVKAPVRMGGLTRTFILHHFQHQFLTFPSPSFRIIFCKIWFLQAQGTACEDLRYILSQGTRNGSGWILVSTKELIPCVKEKYSSAVQAISEQTQNSQAFSPVLKDHDTYRHSL